MLYLDDVCKKSRVHRQQSTELSTKGEAVCLNERRVYANLYKTNVVELLKENEQGSEVKFLSPEI